YEGAIQRVRDWHPRDREGRQRQRVLGRLLAVRLARAAVSLRQRAQVALARAHQEWASRDAYELGKEIDQLHIVFQHATSLLIEQSFGVPGRAGGLEGRSASKTLLFPPWLAAPPSTRAGKRKTQGGEASPSPTIA